MSAEGQRILIYAHDPMCSWCWAFRPVWLEVVERLPKDVTVKRLLGGLAPDCSDPMPQQMQQALQQTWRNIQAAVPGTEFNFDFWTKCAPRRSTYASCRAVIAAAEQGEQHSDAMVYAIQRAYYLQARNPSDDSTLCQLADELGLDVARFAQALNSEATKRAFADHLDECDAFGLHSFPSLALLDAAGKGRPIRIDYNNADAILQQIG